ncbi:MAG: hypothetical protein NVS4B10_16260 [Myxococcales bacterium]
MAGNNEIKGQLPQEKFAEQLDELDEGLANLQVLYEKYFLGIDRKPPELERKKIASRIRELRNTLIKNTGLKFRLNTMFAKLISHERLWDRTLREIEDGTYKRDVFKAKHHQHQGDAPVQRTQPERIELSDDKLRRLYDTWVVARQRTGESVAGMNFDSVAEKIRSQVPGLIQKHRAKSIEFKVVIKGGKAILKAIPHT